MKIRHDMAAKKIFPGVGFGVLFKFKDWFKPINISEGIESCETKTNKLQSHLFGIAELR